MAGAEEQLVRDVGKAHIHGHGADPGAAPNYAPGQVHTIDITTMKETGPSACTGQRNLAQMHDARIEITMFKPDLFLGSHEFKVGLNYTMSELGRTNPISGGSPVVQLHAAFPEQRADRDRNA